MIRVYKYGLLPPTSGSELVHHNIWRGHVYQNELVAAERSKREMFATERAKRCPEIQALETRVAELLSKIEGIDSNFVANTAPKGSLERKRLLKKELKTTRDRLRAVKKELNESGVLQDLKTMTKDWMTAETKRLRACAVSDGLYWGTYLAREAAHKLAQKSSIPNFHRFDGSGYIGVQIQRSAIDGEVGIAASDLDHEKSTMVRVSSLPETQWDTRSGRRHAYTTLRVRVGSDGRSPVWAEFPMLMHRPFPDGARVKTVQINRRRIGHRWKWSVDFTLSIPPSSIATPRTTVPRTSGIVGIDIGWRRDDGLRVATLVDDAGEVETVRLPQSVDGRLSKANSIEGFRDDELNLLKTDFTNLTKLVWPSDWPERVIKTLDNLPAIRSKHRLQSAFQYWRNNRFNGDTAAYTRLEKWYHRDRHLEDYSTGTRERAQCTRREFYRLLARRLVSKYATIIIEKMGLDAMARRAPVENRDDEPGRGARRQRVVAALGEFRTELKQVAASQGAIVIEVNPKWTSKMCSKCGVVGEWSDTAALLQSCASCGHKFDRDVNAATNIMRKGVDARAVQ